MTILLAELAKVVKHYRDTSGLDGVCLLGGADYEEHGKILAAKFGLIWVTDAGCPPDYIYVARKLRGSHGEEGVQ